MQSSQHAQNRIRKGLAILVGVVMVALLLSACGAEQAKVYRVGILNGNASLAPIAVGFKAKMTELGYIENTNIIYIVQDTGSDTVANVGQARKLVDAQVDLIFTSGTPDAVAAQTATQGTDVPVVFAYGQLEGTNLVKNIREPGGNMTGVRYPGPEMISKRLAILLEIVPTAKRLWIGYNKQGPNTAAALAALRPAAAALGVTLVEVAAIKPEELWADLATRAQSADLGLDMMVTMPDDFSTSAPNFALLSKFSVEHKIPLAGGIAFMAKQGALFVNTTNLANVGQLAAPLADKILKGTPAGSIPVVTPEQTLVINYKVAQELGIVVPEGLLSQATEVIR